MRLHGITFFFIVSYQLKMTNADLLSVPSKYLNVTASTLSITTSLFLDNINEYFWIGINDRVTEGRMVWDHRPNMVMVNDLSKLYSIVYELLL